MRCYPGQVVYVPCEDGGIVETFVIRQYTSPSGRGLADLAGFEKPAMTRNCYPNYDAAASNPGRHAPRSHTAGLPRIERGKARYPDAGIKR